MNDITPNKHARFESRYPAEIVTAVNILLRQHIGLDPMPSNRAIARLVEATYPVKISGPTVKRIMDKLICSAPPVPQPLNPLTPNDSPASQSPKVGVAETAVVKDGKLCGTQMDVYC